MRKSSTSYLFECYIWLVNTIARGPISREAIDEKWAHASVNDYKTDSIPESTFHRWRHTVELLFDISIKCNPYGEYYIENYTDLRHDDLRGRMINMFCVNSILKDCQELRKQIILEPVPAGEEYLPAIIESMRDKHLLNIDYQSFKSSQPTSFTVEPYCLKMYRQRWYLIAFTRERNAIRHFALDRIVEIRTTQEPYTIPDDFDAEEYFSNVRGITILKEKPEEIVISVNALKVPYIRTLPLHSSQKEIEIHEGYSLFSYLLIPNNEFIRELRSWGTNVVVRSPEWLCRQFREDNKALYNIYKEISPE